MTKTIEQLEAENKAIQHQIELLEAREELQHYKQRFGGLELHSRITDDTQRKNQAPYGESNYGLADISDMRRAADAFELFMRPDRARPRESAESFKAIWCKKNGITGHKYEEFMTNLVLRQQHII